MHEYIRARTAFFDRAVVRALDEGIAQVVIGGAGYDGVPERTDRSRPGAASSGPEAQPARKSPEWMDRPSWRCLNKRSSRI